MLCIQLYDLIAFPSHVCAVCSRIAVGKQIVRSGPTRNMHAAMRPAASITGQQNLDVRQVEQGGRIVSIPPGMTSEYFLILDIFSVHRVVSCRKRGCCIRIPVDVTVLVCLGALV